MSSVRLPFAYLVLLGAVQPALAQDGAQLYAQHCVACHQPGGTGTPGLAPPLAGTLGGFAATQAGRRYLAQLLVSGVSGRVEYHGPPYFGNMPGFKQLKDEELSQVAAYVLSELNRDALQAGHTPMRAEDFAAARARALSSREVKQLRQTALDRQ